MTVPSDLAEESSRRVTLITRLTGALRSDSPDATNLALEYRRDAVAFAAFFEFIPVSLARAGAPEKNAFIALIHAVSDAYRAGAAGVTPADLVDDNHRAVVEAPENCPPKMLVRYSTFAYLRFALAGLKLMSVDLNDPELQTALKNIRDLISDFPSSRLLRRVGRALDEFEGTRVLESSHLAPTPRFRHGDCSSRNSGSVHNAGLCTVRSRPGRNR